MKLTLINQWFVGIFTHITVVIYQSRIVRVVLLSWVTSKMMSYWQSTIRYDWSNFFYCVKNTRWIGRYMVNVIHHSQSNGFTRIMLTLYELRDCMGSIQYRTGVKAWTYDVQWAELHHRHSEDGQRVLDWWTVNSTNAIKIIWRNTVWLLP